MTSISRTMIALATSLLVGGQLLAASPDREQRHPWEWTVEERIAARCDRTLAAARVAYCQDLHAQSQQESLLTMQRGPRIVDIIDGGRYPELLLPTELFEWTINRGLIDGWVDYNDRARSVGLPPDFWSKLQDIASLYAHDLEERNQLLRTPGDEAKRRMTSLEAIMCRDRADALMRAHAVFGLGLERFMYQYVAPSLIKFIDEMPTRASLKSQEKGCEQ